MSVADVLRQAAALVEQRAAETTPGPWRWATFHGIDELTHPMTVGGMPVHPLNVLKVSHEDWPATDPDKAWIAAMSPQVAGPLAALLRFSATQSEMAAVLVPNALVVSSGVYDVSAAIVDDALALARVILGEASPVPASKGGLEEETGPTVDQGETA